ncbi:hypothetical protein FT663_00599 [Candidozyma haemuli var. vulneris]|uniref:NADPH-dependent diflavin oxidoreductase 1 n=1 Tax=Candidozyma haemuli TaxID=45357 RepID=A0A2V1APT6_9ASCO|nr:hypothetical protein CXQ85_003382 [[Candida] haemuloni]KAF3989023.1 hypothetical protein FT662_03084 [[Candida] haemuloni var. vulneris]KAF3995221.1 hypothetical protein FT663_00599 [[Candida] haemuloni var. vulneris]PVH19536.1 hypothetical protein CXQ85_003382 [[Candida] haemuloni]
MTAGPNVDSVAILYGSESGNAQDYAYFLARKLRYNSLRPTVCSLDSFPLKSLVTDIQYLIVVCSTTGQGEVPRNSKKFIKFLLKKKLPDDLLNHIKFTTFGLGDSSYPKFNYAIKKIHIRLRQLGCKELCPRCESDEQSPEGIDGYYAEWETSVIDALQKEFPNIYSIDDHVLLPPVFKMNVKEDGFDATEDSDLSITRRSKGLSIGTVVKNERKTAEGHFQDVRHMIVEDNEHNLSYIPGDTLALYPPNDDRSVDLLLESQPHWLPFADKPLEIESAPDVEGGFIDSSQLTLRSLIKYHLDVMSIPRRSFFALLHHFVDESTEEGQREKEKLYEFSTLAEAEDLYDYANRPRRSILETIMEFEKNLKIPLEYVLDLFPLIKVRLFSIASKSSTDTVEIIAGIVEYKTILRRIRRGLCTKWIKSLKEGDSLVFSIHKSNLSFSLPDNPNPPILMVSPGTGVAPMKSLIEQKAGQQELHLFYGCRFPNKDYLFQELWETLEAKGLLHMYPCFSREPGSKVKYVQDKIFVEQKTVAKLILEENAIVFVCGSSGNMPRQVRMTLVEILKKTGLEEADADKYLLRMEDSGRYIQETW